MINGNIVAIKPLNLKSADMIIGGNMQIEFVGTKTGFELEKKIDPAVKAATLSYIGNISNITGVKNGEVKIFYDNIEYDSVEFVKTNPEFLSAVRKNNTIVVLEDNILINEKINPADNTVIIGKGKVIAKDLQGSATVKEFKEVRMIEDKSHQAWATAISNLDLTFDGINHKANSITYLPNGKNLIFKNGTIDSTSTWHVSAVDQAGSSTTYENQARHGSRKSTFLGKF